MWVLDHLADIESDFSAIHRITIDPDRNEWGGLSARRFFRLAWRLAAYQGAVQAAVLREKREDLHDGGGNGVGGPGGGGNGGHDGWPEPIPLTPEMARNSFLLEGLDGLIEYSTSGE